MKKVAICFQIILLLPAIAFGAQVFGSLRFENASVGGGVEVNVKCGEKGEREYNGKTDPFGSYSVYLPRPEKCRLAVNFRNQWSEPYDVYSDETDPVRYDFELIRRDNGSFFLRRR